VEIATARLLLREFRPGDEDSLVRNADDRRVWLHLRDRFPHPYTRADAEQWIAHARGEAPPSSLAIVLGDEVIGGVGFERGSDVTRFNAEVGYWVGARHWGHGYATEAVAAFVDYVFASFPFERLQAWVFAPNLSSRRVLEKCGFELEGVARRSVFKENRFLDSYLYARLRDSGAKATPEA
jgi:RimJ/RimL family protein N-acetyltransferase